MTCAFDLNGGRMSSPFAPRLDATRLIDDDPTRALQTGLVSPRRVVNNYHDLRNGTLPAYPYSDRLSVECVLCRDKEPDGDANPFAITSPRINGFDHSFDLGPPPASDSTLRNHTFMIMPCGHLAGWECLQKYSSDYCPLCSILFRRNTANRAHCHHEIQLHTLRLYVPLSAEEAEWLIPRDGVVAERCRECMTLESLRELTILARRAVPVNAQCAYATDGVLHGFLENDQLKPFLALDIPVQPPLIPPLLIEMAYRREETIRQHYERKGIPAENRMMLNRHFVFRIAALARPLADQA